MCCLQWAKVIIQRQQTELGGWDGWWWTSGRKVNRVVYFRLDENRGSGGCGKLLYPYFKICDYWLCWKSMTLLIKASVTVQPVARSSKVHKNVYSNPLNLLYDLCSKVSWMGCIIAAFVRDKISDGTSDLEFFFRFSAGSAFHRCANVGWTAVLYGRMAQDDRDHFHPRWPLKEHTCFSVHQKCKKKIIRLPEKREWERGWTDFFLLQQRP